MSHFCLRRVWFHELPHLHTKCYWDGLRSSFLFWRVSYKLNRSNWLLDLAHLCPEIVYRNRSNFAILSNLDASRIGPYSWQKGTHIRSDEFHICGLDRLILDFKWRAILNDDTKFYLGTHSSPTIVLFWFLKQRVLGNHGNNQRSICSDKSYMI